MFKKGLSLLLILIISISILTNPVNTVAKSTAGVTTGNTTNDISLKGTSSLGEMLTDEYKEYTSAEENTNYKIYDTVVDGNTVCVELITQTASQLIVALYDDDGKNMYCTGFKDVVPDDKIVQVEMNVPDMPEYFYIKAYLLDPETKKPLCKQFECNTYTRQMQEFFATTTDDFDSELVMNLDDDNKNNFLVYDENTVFIKGTERKNTLHSHNDESRKYTFINADNTLTSLNSGDVISYSANDKDPVILKISSISISGTTVEILTEDLALEEAFQFIKIDVFQGAGKTTADTSSLPEGVEYKGVTDNQSKKSDKEVVSTGSAIVNEDITRSDELKYEFKNALGLDIDGEVTFRVTVNLSCYYDFRWFEDDEVDFSLTIAYELGMNLSVELVSVEGKIELGRLSFMPVPGISIGFTPAFVVEGSVKTELNGTLSGQIGKRFLNGTFYDENKPAKLSCSLKVSAELFIGLSLTPDISIAGSVFTVEMEAKAGVLITATLELRSADTSDEPPEDGDHGCKSCVEGDTKFVIKLSFTLRLLDCKKLSWTAEAIDHSVPINDFYYSFDLGKGGFTKCPNRSHKQMFIITGADGTLIKGASVNGHITDALGMVTFSLPMGEYVITIQKENVTETRTIDVHSERIHLFSIDYTPDPKETTDPTTPTVPKPPAPTPQNGVVLSGQCGTEAYYSLSSDGTLVITGSGSMWNYSAEKSPFYGNTFIRKVVIGSKIWSVGSRAFHKCTNLTDVIIGDSTELINTAAFSECTSLVNLKFGIRVYEIGKTAFGGCTSLSELTLPPHLQKIGENAFIYCENLKNINLNSNNKLTVGESAFQNCSSLEYADIGENVTNISPNAFRECTNLKRVTVSGISYIEERVFAYCSSLKEVNLGENVTVIDKYAFQYCTGLEKIVIPDNVFKINEGAFNFCSNLSEVVFGTGLQTIGDNVFYNSENVTGIPSHLSDIYYRGSEEDWKKINISSNNKELLRATIHYNFTDKGINSTGKSAPASTGSVLSQTSATDNQNTVSGKYTRDGLVPHSQAVLMIIKGTADDYQINSSSLLYITQTTVDENGTADFTTYGNFSNAYWVVFIQGKCNHNDTQWINCKKATVLQDGMDLCICTKCGEIADTRNVVAEKPIYTPGDVVQDSRININDVTHIQRYISGMITLDDSQLLSSDINCDGEINIRDVTLLQKYLANIITTIGQ